MKIPNVLAVFCAAAISLARIVSEDSQQAIEFIEKQLKSSKDS